MKRITDKYRKKLMRLGIMACVIACMTGPAFAAEADTVAIDNGIPVVTLNIDESRGSIKDMNASEDHSVHCYGTLQALKPGWTKVRVCAWIYSSKGPQKLRKTVVVNVSEGSQENAISCTGGSIAVKRSAVKKKARTIPAVKVLSVQDAKGSLRYELLSVSRNGTPAQKKLFKVNAKAGSVKVKKGLKKGTYQLMVRVQDAGTAEYRPATAETAVQITVR